MDTFWLGVWTLVKVALIGLVIYWLILVGPVVVIIGAGVAAIYGVGWIAKKIQEDKVDG